MNARSSLVVFLLACASVAAADDVDLSVVHRIKQEAFQNGKVMDHLFFLTDVGGPRLTASPGQRAAADWAIARLKSWGIDSARSEPWGRFGRSWRLERFSAHQLTPTYAPLHGIPLAWSGGTRGRVAADVVLAPVFERCEDAARADPARVAARVQEYARRERGKLAGRVVLIEPLREPRAETAPAVSRLDDAELAKLAAAPEPETLLPLAWPITKLPDDPKESRRLQANLPLEVADDYWTRQARASDPLWSFLREEGVPAVLVNDAYGRDAGGLLFAESAGFWRAGSPVPPPVVVLASESYGRLARLAERHEPVRVELEVAVEMPEEDRDGANVIAEIPGGEQEGRGRDARRAPRFLARAAPAPPTTPPAAPSMIEAMRILKALDAAAGPHRAHRAVERRRAGPARLARLREGALRRPDDDAAQARAREARRPTSTSTTAPARSAASTCRATTWCGRSSRPGSRRSTTSAPRTITIRNTGGTDHLSFDARRACPASSSSRTRSTTTRAPTTRTWTSTTTSSRADLMQASAIMASFVYHAAMRAEMLPRKPLPKPLPPRTDAAAR